MEDEQADSAISVIEKICKSRKQVTSSPSPMVNSSGTYTPFPFEVLVGGATVFVLTVDEFKKF